MGCSGIITATCNATAQLSRRVYDDFISGKKQLYDQKLKNIRSVFDNYNLISALHTFYSKEDEDYKNVLPPLRVLNDQEKRELLDSLDSLNFTLKSQLAA